MRRYLDQTCCFRQIQRRITNLGQKECIDLRIELEILQNSNPFRISGSTINVGSFHVSCIVFQSKQVVAENNYFVTSILVKLDQVLTNLKLPRIHDVIKSLFSRCLLLVFLIKFHRHFTPNFSTLYFGDVTLISKLHPVCFVQFRPDDEVEIGDLVVFSQ